MVNIKSFKRILRKSQSELKATLTAFVKSKNYNPVIGDGFLYGKGTLPILLVAHMDTVHLSKPEHIYYDESQQIVWSPEGIGGDDRCGVYLIMRLLENGYRPHVLFLEDEEKGCVGAEKCVDIIKAPKVKFIIEIDRRGKDDCVFYDCFNVDFMEYISNFEFKEAEGTFSDICVLSKAWDIASVNLSSGYYNEHTKYEYINLVDMINTYKRVAKILDDDENNTIYFDYDEVVYQPSITTSKTNNAKSLAPADASYWDEWGYTDKDGKWHWYGEA